MCGAISIIFGKPGNALTLTLSRRERGLVTHPLRPIALESGGHGGHLPAAARIKAA